ncbi:MAG: hypothetical protein U9O94_10760 [Nanoarchaeota archaeon]|nr:hypothetical protein [Nanoarchaeota archaeon]
MIDSDHMVLRLLMFSVEAILDEKDTFSSKTSSALREYADRIDKTGGKELDKFMSKSGCQIKMFHTMCSNNQEENDEHKRNDSNE